MRIVSIGSRPLTVRPKPPAMRDSFNHAAQSNNPFVNRPQPPVFKPHPQAPKPPAPSNTPPPHAFFNLSNMATGDIRFITHAILPDTLPAAQFLVAAATGDIATVRALLQQPALLPDTENGNGVTALMLAAARGHTEIVELLAAHPLVNLGKATVDGWTALHYAAYFNQPGAIASLLKHHAPMDIRGSIMPSSPLAHELATQEKAQDAFWQDKNFKRFMKTLDPQHPKLKPKLQPLRVAAPAFP